jgi:hypothetical protein
MRSISTTFSIVLILCASIAGNSTLFAQAPHHLLIGNGGQFGPGNHVTVASWEISSGIYEVFDSIPASSVQDLITSGQFAWLAADSFLVKYDLSNYQRLDSVVVHGIRKVATYQSMVLVTRGFGADSNYVQAFKQSDLSLVWSVNGLSGQCEGIVVYEDSAYVAEPVAFGSSVNYLAVVNLSNGQLVREVQLGGTGLSAGRVLASGSDIYVVLNSPFGGTEGGVEHFDAATQASTHTTVPGNISGGMSLHNGLLYLFIDGSLASYNTATNTVDNATLVSGSWIGATRDKGSGEFYVSETDFSTYGTVRRYDAFGSVLDSVNVGISPEVMALDAYISTDLQEESIASSWIHCWPNPASTLLHLSISHRLPVTLSIIDMMGRTVLHGPRSTRYAEIDLSTLSNGTYFLKAISSKGQETVKFIKLNR